MLEICLFCLKIVAFPISKKYNRASAGFYRLLKRLRMLSSVTKNSHKPFSGIAAAGHFFYCFYLCLLFQSSFLIGIVKCIWFSASTVYLLIETWPLLLSIYVFTPRKESFSRCDVFGYWRKNFSDQFMKGITKGGPPLLFCRRGENQNILFRL